MHQVQVHFLPPIQEMMKKTQTWKKGIKNYCQKIIPRKDERQMQLNKRKYDEDGFYNFEDDHNYGIV